MSTQAAFAAALLDPGLPAIDGLRTWNGSDPARRFAVYRNNVVVSLVDALADTFPVVQELVGEAFFRAMARVFVLVNPPRGRLMAFYGAAFPDFVEAFPPAAGVPYLADVARLEYLRVRAYHAADASPLATGEIVFVLADPAALPSLRLTLDPSLHVLFSRFAVGSLWGAHQGVLSLAEVTPDISETVLILRCALDVEVLKIARADGAFVSALLEGRPLAHAVAATLEIDPSFSPAEVLALLLQKRLVLGFKHMEIDHE